jgi:hypothetical protein
VLCKDHIPLEGVGVIMRDLSLGELFDLIVLSGLDIAFQRASGGGAAGRAQAA